jgi:hypothetical protein
MDRETDLDQLFTNNLENAGVNNLKTSDKPA